MSDYDVLRPGHRAGRRPLAGRPPTTALKVAIAVIRPVGAFSEVLLQALLELRPAVPAPA